MFLVDMQINFSFFSAGPLARIFFFCLGGGGGDVCTTPQCFEETPGATYRVQQEQIYLNKETILVYIEKMILYKH